MLIILTLCLVLAWLFFTQFKIIKLGWVSGAVTAIIGAVIVAVFLALFNYRPDEQNPIGRYTRPKNQKYDVQFIWINSRAPSPLWPPQSLGDHEGGL